MLFISVEAGYHLFTCEETSSEVDQLFINTEPVDIVKVSMTPEASSTMRDPSAARSDVRLSTFGLKIGTRTTSAHEHSHC